MACSMSGEPHSADAVSHLFPQGLTDKEDNRQDWAQTYCLCCKHQLARLCATFNKGITNVMCITCFVEKHAFPTHDIMMLTCQ